MRFSSHRRSIPDKQLEDGTSFRTSYTVPPGRLVLSIVYAFLAYNCSEVRRTTWTGDLTLGGHLLSHFR